MSGISLLFILLSLSHPAQEIFQQANQAYEAARFEEAIRLYDSALVFINSSIIYYNRGNAHFKSGAIGRAIADYLCAWRLAPRDGDINFNLNYCRQFRVDKNLAGEGMLARMLRTVFTWFNPLITRLIAASLFLCGSVVFSFYFLTRRRFSLIPGFIILLLFILELGSVIYWRNATAKNIAVVVRPEVIIRAGPGGEYREIAAVHDGLEVKIVEFRPEWVLIQIPGGVGGWVERNAVEQVFR